MEISKSDQENRVIKGHMTRQRSYGVKKHNSDELNRFFEATGLKKTIQPGNVILDIGCAYGLALQGVCEQFNCTGYGVDIWSMGYNFNTPEKTLKRIDCHDMRDEFRSNMFDICYSYCSYMYFYNKLLALQEIHRVLKVGGKAVIQTDLGLPRDGMQPPLSKLYSQLSDEDELSILEYGEKEIYSEGKKGEHNAFNQVVMIHKKNNRPLKVPVLKQVTAVSDYRYAQGDELRTICHYE